MHITRGSSREPRPDLHHVMLDVMVEPQAGIPLLLPPRRGHTREANELGDVVTAHLAPRQTTDGTSALVADSALYRAGNLHTRAHPGRRWSTRVPAPLPAAHNPRVQATPATMIPLSAGDRAQALAST